MIRRAGRGGGVLGAVTAMVTVGLLLFPGAGRAQTLTVPLPMDSATESAGDDPFEEILLEFRIGRMARTTVRAYWDGEIALLPAAAVLDVAEIARAWTPDGALEATLHPHGTRIRVERASRSAFRNGEVVPAPPEWIRPDPDGDVYVAAPVMGALLGVTLQPDWEELAVVVRNPEGLPVARRLDREARWDALRGRHAASARVPRLELDAPALGGAVLDWGLSNSAEDPRNTAAYSVGLATRVLGGSLRVSQRSLGPAVQGAGRFDATYQAVLADAGWLTQIRLGDGFSTGPRLRDVRGFALTNAPYLRDVAFGSDAFAGRAGPGWEVELRQAGQTLDLTRADEQGAFALDIPLRYGENALQVVAFGPHGEVVTTERLLVMDRDRLPAGRFEWGISGGECRSARCRSTGNVDLRYGLSRRWTVRAGAEGFTRDTLASLVQPYVGLSGALTPSILLSLEGVRAGHLRAGAAYAPSPRIRVRAAHTAFSGHLDEPVLHDARRRRTTESDVLFRPDPARPRLLLRASLLDEGLEDRSRTRVQGSVTFPLGNLGIETGLRRELENPELGPRLVRDFQFAALSGMMALPGRRVLTLRTELELAGGDAVERARAQVGYQISSGTRLEVGAGWQRFTGASLVLSVSSYLPQLRNVTQLVAREGSRGQVSQFSQGTVYWNEATSQVSLAPGPGIERGGISGYVFVDANGNGILDPGEKGLEGVRVVVGNRAVTTDRLGRHAAWDLVPFEPVEVWADSASISDPFLVPSRDQVQVRVPPSSFGRVNIPVSPSRELMGRVVLVTGGESVALPYARLELMDLSSGRTRTLRSFSDGEFYESGIRPGRYELRLDPEYLRATGLVPLAAWVEVEVEAGSDPSPVGPIVLRVIPGEEQDPQAAADSARGGSGGA